ncbi:DUF2313 domain-containing protein [Lelliottia sp. V106_10]|uniref:putative phage tail protein n=1 Tax=Lelliottia wanjuensis TaxID=3050585 RepID=UPI00254C7C8F|nr:MULTISPECIES: putative phage tail protein [unclassified Lelliottia]MDK9356685.1 DUF2313 domain-containing protein [Lelliottia sp. V106_16]MDK9373443.1 DUF2313 domain-containing protein [Lelliottia sp. V106_10]MDK9600236.1 DUF2313 domain-containing protein [Lelliottia sp. V106_5]
MGPAEQLKTDYFQQLQKLIPHGPAWSENDELLMGLAPAFAAVHQRAIDFVRETNPSQTIELLERWEYCCALPDSCSIPGADTIEQRQERLAVKFNLTGAITEQFYLDVLTELGYPNATITTFEGVEGEEFTWQVNMPFETKIREMSCLGICSDSIRTWGETTAECVLNKLCASHTILNFTYPE